MATPNMSRTDWAILVLQDLGVPVSANNLAFMNDWMLSENSEGNWAPRNNPLNNGLGSGGGSGLGSYSDLATAAQEVANNLKNGSPQYGYGAVVSALQSSAPPTQTAQAIVDSDWAGGHYNNGANWAGGAVAYAGAPQTSAGPTTANSTLADTQTQNLNIPGLGNTPATTQEATAYDTISADLQAYFDPTDAAALATWAWNKITTNEDPTQIAIDIQSTPQFLNAFPGFAPANAELQKNGLPAVSVQQYQQYQTQAMAMAQAAGLPTGFINSQNIGTLVGNNVSTTELSARLNDATTLAINSTPEQQQMFNQYFGTGYGDSGHGPLTTGQIAALALDPSVAEPLIAQQVTAAKIGGASVTSGVGALNVSTATQLAQAGITATQATSAFQNLAPYSALETARPGMGGEAAQGTITPDQIAQGQLLGSPAAQRQLQTAVEVAKAPFSGGGGFVGTSKGTAAGSANPNGTGNA